MLAFQQTPKELCHCLAIALFSQEIVSLLHLQFSFPVLGSKSSWPVQPSSCVSPHPQMQDAEGPEQGQGPWIHTLLPNVSWGGPSPSWLESIILARAHARPFLLGPGHGIQNGPTGWRPGGSPGKHQTFLPSAAKFPTRYLRGPAKGNVTLP